MKRFAMLWVLTHALAGCATERLYVKVLDDEGNPVTNGIVRVGFSTSHVLLGGGNSATPKSGHAEGRTDNDGNAVVKFNCQSSDFGWHVEADGYYRGISHSEHFKFDEAIVPPGVGTVILHEHEKKGVAMLYRKKNPQPMFAYSREKEVKAPIENGRYGFDLQVFDWLPPLGKGYVADFYYVRERKDLERIARLTAEKKTHLVRAFRSDEQDAPKLGDVVGRIEFDVNCGAYIRSQTGNENFPSTYAADTDVEYEKEIPIKICANNGQHWLHEGPVIPKGKYIVIRSRVKCDEKGRIVSAHYSKILGPWGIGALMCPYETVFNPVPNDPNLEFDPARNLYQGKKGRGMIP